MYKECINKKNLKRVRFLLLMNLFVVFGKIKPCLLEQYLQSFDSCMNASSIKYQKKYGKDSNKKVIEVLKNLYERNHFLNLDRSEFVKIPKIIHQIWIGPKPVPDLVKKLAKSWQKFHPNWDYILWTNDMVEELLPMFLPEHRELYLFAKDVREKADILRYYLLYWYGGLYVDVDCLCLASFEELHFYYDFYVGITSNATSGILNNAVIGSKPHHLIIEHLIQNIKKASVKNWYLRSGFLFFSESICDVIASFPGINIALPCNVFYPEYRKTKLLENCENNMCFHYWATETNPNWEEGFFYYNG